MSFDPRYGETLDSAEDVLSLTGQARASLAIQSAELMSTIWSRRSGPKSLPIWRSPLPETAGNPSSNTTGASIDVSTFGCLLTSTSLGMLGRWAT